MTGLQVTGGNWATSQEAEVDGIRSSRGGPWGDWTVYARDLFNVIDDHSSDGQDGKCAFCARLDLTETPTSMHVLPMPRSFWGDPPYSWLA